MTWRSALQPVGHFLRGIARGIRQVSAQHWLQAFVAGAAVTVVILALCYALLEWWPWLWGYQASGDTAANLSQRLAFAQVYTGFVAIFLGASLGLYAIKEFAQAQEQPKLELYFQRLELVDNPEQRVILAVAASDPGTEELRLVVRNRGTVGASHYQIDFGAPFLQHLWSERGKSVDAVFSPDGPVVPLVGEIGKSWKLARADRFPDEFGLLFTSYGDHPIYPGQALELCRFVLAKEYIPNP